MAVYTDVSNEALSQFLKGYDLGAPVRLEGIAQGVENSNFHLWTERDRYILTIYEKRVAEDDLPFFLDLMEHLANRDVPCPLPVHQRCGSALARLCGKPAAIVTFLTGKAGEPTTAHCREAGAALGRLHEGSHDFSGTRHNALGPAAWPPLFEACRARAEEVSPGLGPEIENALSALRRDWPREALAQGIIHADFFPDNVLFSKSAQGETVSGVIDFYFACADSLAYDVAIAINAWCFDPGGARFVPERARALISGYEEIRALTPAEREALPVLCAGAALRFLLTRLYDWLHGPREGLVRPKDPLAYLNRLRFFRDAMDDPRSIALN